MTRIAGMTLCSALLGIVLMAVGCADAPQTRGVPALAALPSPPGAHAQLFVIKRGWHIDIGFAVQSLAPPLQAVQAEVPGARYVLFGFGDRRYLTARIRRMDALIAALCPGAALVLLTGLSDRPQAAFGTESVRTLALRGVQMQAVQAFIWRTLAHAQGRPEPVQSGPYPGSVYFAAVPRYSGVHTCNSWAAEALHAAGLPAHTRAVVFAWQLWRQLPRLQRVATRVD